MMQYECAVVLAVTLAEEQLQQQIEQIKAWISTAGGEISDVEVWGQRRLAYPIAKHQDGFYIFFYFSINEARDRLTELERRLNTSEVILRHLLVRLPALEQRPRVPAEQEGMADTGSQKGAAPQAEAADSDGLAEPASRGEAVPADEKPEPILQ